MDIIERITRIYEQDQASQRVAMTAAELPLSYDSVTDQWLTDVLCRNAPGAAVLSHQLATPDTGSSNRMKMRVEYNQAGRHHGLPEALFCKASHDLTNRIVLGVSGGADVEAKFYNKIRPLLDIEAPTCLYAKHDPESFNSMIILVDLSDSVTEFCSHRTDMTRARAESQIRLLAKLHGTAYASPLIAAELASYPTWPEYFERTLAFGMREGSSQGFLAAKEVIPDRLYERAEAIWPATLASVNQHHALPHTISHGDVHLKNWYVAGNGEMGLSDWQCCSRGYWARDFAYTISTALTVDNRRAWEKDLLALYLKCMAEAGGPVVAFGEAWNHYRRQLLTALTWWTVTLTPPPGLPDMQPKDITLEFIRRISTAMDDVDSLGAF